MAKRVTANGNPSSSRAGVRNGSNVAKGNDPATRQPAATVDNKVSTNSTTLMAGRERSPTDASGTACTHVLPLSRFRNGV